MKPNDINKAIDKPTKTIFDLKNNITTESISRTVLNSLRIHQLRGYLKDALQKRKTALAFK